jgi:hypothetical protein
MSVTMALIAPPFAAATAAACLTEPILQKLAGNPRAGVQTRPRGESTPPPGHA